MPDILTNQELILKLSKHSAFKPVRILVSDADAAVAIKDVVMADDQIYIIPDNNNAVITSEKLLEILS